MGPTLHDPDSLSDLTALVSHEFNNHLNGIFLRLALLEQEFPEAKDQLRVIRSLGDEAAALIRRLQQANRPTIPPPEPVDVNRLIREVGPISDLAPEFPLAADAVGPLRARSEALGSKDFMLLLSGQFVAPAHELPAGELTRKVAAETLELLQTLSGSAKA